MRFLLSRLTTATVIMVSGTQMLNYLQYATALARRLEPAVVVLEDVDLVAEDRSFDYGGSPMLFELLNEIDGIGSEADVTFLLTTNRVEVIERALADRPGRVDLAIEIPKPDAECRERLLRLYARGANLDLPDAAPLVAATEGVTASFIKEWVRRAILHALDTQPTLPCVRLDMALLATVLDELHNERQTLTRNILGGHQS